MSGLVTGEGWWKLWSIQLVLSIGWLTYRQTDFVIWTMLIMCWEYTKISSVSKQYKWFAINNSVHLASKYTRVNVHRPTPYLTSACRAVLPSRLDNVTLLTRQTGVADKQKETKGLTFCCNCATVYLWTRCCSGKHSWRTIVRYCKHRISERVNLHLQRVTNTLQLTRNWYVFCISQQLSERRLRDAVGHSHTKV